MRMQRESLGTKFALLRMQRSLCACEGRAWDEVHYKCTGHALLFCATTSQIISKQCQSNNTYV